MKTLAFLTLALLLAAIPSDSRSHPFHQNAVVMLAGLNEPDPDDSSGRTMLWLHLINGTGNAVTLRKVTLIGHGALEIERQRDFLLFKIWQPVTFIRLDPGEELVMVPPWYRISVPKSALAQGGLNLIADFGPAGQLEAYQPNPYTISDEAIGQ